MISFSRAWRWSVVPVLLLASPLVARTSRTPAPTPGATPTAAPVSGERFIANREAWLYRGSDITPDPAWRFGTLTNGLRYAIRNNGVPPGQVSVRVRIDAGSLMERDSERGYAHLIEHLSFQSSPYVPFGEARRIWQRMGTTFGSDTNAQTSPISTVYKLDLPAATPANLDESLHLLSGMVSAPTIDDRALAGERPAVLAEQREAPGPQVRVSDARNAVFFAGQPLAERSPIGSVATLEAATPATVQAFHDRWYRPERALVVVVGDVDPATAEQMLARHFGTWTGTGPAPAEPDFGEPSTNHPATGSLVEPTLPAMVQMAVLRPWHFNNDTVLFNQNRLVDQIAIDVINRRLEERARAGGSYLVAQVGIDDIQRSANTTLVLVQPIGNDWQAALRDVRQVIADAQAVPPTQAEVDRAIADRGVAFRTQVETAAVAPGSGLADDMVGAVDIRETTTAPQTVQAVFEDARRLNMFAPARLHAAMLRVFQGIVRGFITVQAPDANINAELATAISRPVTGAARRQQLARVTFDQLPRIGTPSAITSRTSLLGQDDLVQVNFTNGARAMLFHSPSESGRVYVRVAFGGGYNALPSDRRSPAWAAELALVQGGIGRLNQGQLDQMTAGRRISMDFDIEPEAFSLSAMTSPADLRDQLRLIAAYLRQPGWDPNPVVRARSAQLLSQSAYDSSPDGILSRDLEGRMRAGDPRWTAPTAAEIQALTPAAFRQFWEPRLAAGPLEVQVFGDIDTAQAITLIQNTIGALPPRTPLQPQPGPALPFAAHVAQPVLLTHGGQDNQAAAVIAWPTGGGTANIADARRLDILSAIFTDRLFEQLRGRAGASYSPSVQSDWPIGNPGGGRFVAIGKVAPANLPLFFRLAREIAADLVAHPVSADELQRVLVPMRESVLRASTGNTFWLQRLEGGTYDPSRLAALRGILSDVQSTTAADLQAVAARYLRPDTDWTLEVRPRSGAGAASAAPATATVH